MQKWIVRPKRKMARYADRESANAKEAEVWKKDVRIDQKIVQRTAQRMKKQRILETIVKIGIRIKIKIGTRIEMRDVINMTAKNANAAAAAARSAVAKDRQNRIVMTTIVRAKNEKCQVNVARAQFLGAMTCTQPLCPTNKTLTINRFQIF